MNSVLKMTEDIAVRFFLGRFLQVSMGKCILVIDLAMQLLVDGSKLLLFDDSLSGYVEIIIIYIYIIYNINIQLYIIA